MGNAFPAKTVRFRALLRTVFYGAVITWLLLLTYKTYGDGASGRTVRGWGSTDVQLGAAQLARHRPGETRQRIRFGSNTTFLEGIKTCESFKCVKEAHLLPREGQFGAGDGNGTGTKFNFPHFLIAGYSKSATTSLYKHLNMHPQVLSPVKKEPGYLSEHCKYIGRKIKCSPEFQQDYLVHLLKRDEFVKRNGEVAPYEATPRILDMWPELAEILAEIMPWVKLVGVLREPISRAISKYHMFATKFGLGCYVNETLPFCLRNDRDRWYGYPRKSYYSDPLWYWLDNFPTDQLKIIQYEDLVGDRQAEELHGLKEFLGLDPTLTGDSLSWGLEGEGDDSGNANCRHCDSPGWPIDEFTYRQMVDKVRIDTEQLVRLLDKHRLADGARWRQNWERIWADNLATCKEGECLIQLS